MVTQEMKLDVELAAAAPGFRSEADVVRYALQQTLPGLLVRARDRYAGRTRLIVDTAEEPAKEVVRHDRGQRPPSMRRPDVPAGVTPWRDALEETAEELMTRDQQLGYVVSGDPFAAKPGVQ
jgi:hypothetical protein